ncbi:hypothetical protein ANANG_G00184190 [Anguilla anguilla]|uniref:Uncharacterized protein n=1 Tax=Anguilla anguilla TaxID=7936 RepID=A0A9D3M5T7_ANGAN|nr:hypothetical protein ANANG_G00184190 [Anguilla anguilla]
MQAQVDYCQSSEDYLKFDGGLMEQTAPPHPHSSSAGRRCQPGRFALLGPVQGGPVQGGSGRAQLFPIDMQGNQILLYSQAPLDSSPPSAGGGAGRGGPPP